MIRVIRATGFTTVQDLGWRGYRSIGLPQGGAADRTSLQVANVLVGNRTGAAALELALGQLTVGFEAPTWFALTGASEGILASRPIGAGQVHRALEGQELALTAGSGARFGYLAVAGGLAVDQVLGSRSTYLPSGLGGFRGRRLQVDDQLPIGPAIDPPSLTVVPGALAQPTLGPIRITAAPQSQLFPDAAHRTLVDHPYRISAASDRMGTRLTGPPLPIRMTATLPSESTCLGAIQVPDDGQPIVVLMDGPTVGGYPKIGAVIGADLDRFAQTPLGEAVRFTWVSVAEARRAARQHAREVEARISAIRASRSA
jgi:biotin-dependent carboxylase-like uncharacterized protein